MSVLTASFRSSQRLLLGLLAVLSTSATPAAWAGSSTAESIWDLGNARQRALSQVPTGATVTGTRCETVNVGIGNYRYICTVTYSEAPPSPSPNPNGANAPSP
jgi:hypothetical protein